MAGKSGQNLNDRTPFWGSKTSNELKYLQQVLNNKLPQVNISRSCFNDLLKCIKNSHYIVVPCI
jgi:hypothetical protein